MLNIPWFKTKRESELESHVFDVERLLFESQQFESIASEKLQKWVTAHDELLIKHKGLVARIKKLHPRMKI